MPQIDTAQGQLSCTSSSQGWSTGLLQVASDYEESTSLSHTCHLMVDEAFTLLGPVTPSPHQDQLY